MLLGCRVSTACPDLLSDRRKEGGTQALVSRQRKIWVRGCRCLVASSCSSR